jgi:uncharacterized protein (DUF2384 family)
MGNPLERRSFDIGWLVGIIDGEGCFTLARKLTSKGGFAYFPVIQITNTNTAIIQKADAIIKDSGLACMVYSKQPKRGKPFQRLEVRGLKRVQRFMELFGDLFECRKAQCALLREYVALRLSKQSHAPITSEEHGIAERLRGLNSRTYA